MSYYRALDDVVRAIRRATEEGIYVNFLIGAGCSISAKIPSASGFIDEIKTKYFEEYERTEIQNYANCMSKLTPPERRKLISGFVNNASINWAHASLAQLLKHNFINRILTTNFDNLILRACATVGEFPAIYDLATSVTFRPDLLFDKSVIHLHGQHTGFILCNTEKEMNNQINNIESVYKELNKNSMWVIIGYSGENDAIFELLTAEKSFEHRLFIVGYKDNDPSERYLELLNEERYAFYIKGYDADDFMVNLAKKLSCFPPSFVQKPFTYLANSLNVFAPYKIPSSLDEQPDTPSFHEDLIKATKTVIDKAINTIENDELLMATHYYHSGLFEEVIALDNPTCSTELNLYISRAYTHLGGYENCQIALERMRKSVVEDEKEESLLVELGLAFNNVMIEILKENREGQIIEHLIQALEYYTDISTKIKI